MPSANERERASAPEIGKAVAQANGDERPVEARRGCKRGDLSGEAPLLHVAGAVRFPQIELGAARESEKAGIWRERGEGVFGDTAGGDGDVFAFAQRGE